MRRTEFLGYNNLRVTIGLGLLDEVVGDKVSRHILRIALMRDIEYSNTLVLIKLFLNLPIPLYRSCLLSLAVLVALISSSKTVVLGRVNDVFLELIGVIDIVGYLLRLEHARLWRAIMGLLNDEVLIL